MVTEYSRGDALQVCKLWDTNYYPDIRKIGLVLVYEGYDSPRGCHTLILNGMCYLFNYMEWFEKADGPW